MLSQSVRRLLPAPIYRSLRYLAVEGPLVLRESADKAGESRRQKSAQFFTGRRIALVGPSPSILGLGQGPAIDEYDLIVRLNSALPLDPTQADDLGSRCDVLLSSLHVAKNTKEDPGVPIDPQAWIDQGVKYLICGYPRWHPRFRGDLDRYLQQHADALPFAWASRKQHHQQSRDVQARPTTGYAAIRFLLDLPIDELFITGFTFMRDGYQKTYREVSQERAQQIVKSVGVHQPENELQHLRRIAAADPRVKLDPVLQRIFDAEPPL